MMYGSDSPASVCVWWQGFGPTSSLVQMVVATGAGVKWFLLLLGIIMMGWVRHTPTSAVGLSVCLSVRAGCRSTPCFVLETLPRAPT